MMMTSLIFLFLASLETTESGSSVTEMHMRFIDRKIILCKSGMSRIQCLLGCQVNPECRYSAEAERRNGQGWECVHFGGKIQTSDLIPTEWKTLTKKVKGTLCLLHLHTLLCFLEDLLIRTPHLQPDFHVSSNDGLLYKI